MAEFRENTTILGSDATFKGELTFTGVARIQGTLEGTVQTAGEIHVEAGGNVKASIEAKNVVVDGTVSGDLTASERVELLAHAQVKGDVTAKTLVVVEGAAFTGHCTIGAEAGSKARTGTTPVAKPTRLARLKADTDWLAEPVATPAGRSNDWVTQVKPAWEEPKGT